MQENVLVVNDRAARAIGRRLAPNDFIVMGNPPPVSEALERVDALQPRLVLMGVDEGEGNGEPEAARAIRERRSVPTVFFSLPD